MYLKGNHGWLNHSQLKMKPSVCGLKQVMLRAWEGALLFDLFIQFSLCISETDPKYNRLWELSNKKRDRGQQPNLSPTFTDAVLILLWTQSDILEYSPIFCMTGLGLGFFPKIPSNRTGRAEVSIQIETVVQANFSLPSPDSGYWGWGNGCPFHSLWWRLIIRAAARGTENTQHVQSK